MAAARRRQLDLNQTPETLAAQIRSGNYGSRDDLLELARDLRRRADGAEQDFMLFLRGLELSEVWREGGYSGTWESFMTANALATADRYRRSVRAFEEIDRPVISLIGMLAAKQTIRIEDPVVRNRVLTQFINTAQANGSMPLSEQTARRIISEVIPPTSRANAQADRIRTLEAENTGLRRRIAELEAIIESLGGDPHASVENQQGGRQQTRRGRNRSQTAS